MLKKLRNFQINTVNYVGQYNELCWISTEPPQPMRRHLSDGQPGVSAIVEICDPLEFFELIVADEIVDHIAANLFKFICKPIYW